MILRLYFLFNRPRYFFQSRENLVAISVDSLLGKTIAVGVTHACYNSPMGKTLTIRLDKKQDEALKQRVRATGKTRSEIVRELIDRGLEEESLGQRVGYLEGVLDVPEPKDPLRRRIKQRNWR